MHESPVLTGGEGGVRRVDAAARHSRVLWEPDPRLVALFRSQIHRLLPDVLIRMDHEVVVPTAVDVQLTVHEDGGHFCAHADALGRRPPGPAPVLRLLLPSRAGRLRWWTTARRRNARQGDAGRAVGRDRAAGEPPRAVPLPLPTRGDRGAGPVGTLRGRPVHRQRLGVLLSGTTVTEPVRSAEAWPSDYWQVDGPPYALPLFDAPDHLVPVSARDRLRRPLDEEPVASAYCSLEGACGKPAGVTPTAPVYHDAWTAWVRHPGHGACLPYLLDGDGVRVVESAAAGRPPPRPLSRLRRWQLVAPGVLTLPEQHDQERARWELMAT